MRPGVGSMSDSSGFAQRIKVAAWALRQEGAFDQFFIERDRESGIVTILNCIMANTLQHQLIAGLMRRFLLPLPTT
jgi:hypothetical protein